ncbi:hypothetical protein Scep_028711 [Stephania cephalantha]|uniref:BCAS3 domain-containing protein n=1 Tax=Stephania cephalantha TaxID=152367 RepID=A0AAP0EAH4_9MAGN
MRNDVQRPRGAVPKSGRSNGFIPNSFRAISSYFKIVSSGASTVASTVRTAGATVANSILDRDEDGSRDQVRWAGFDKLESEGDITRQVLLLGYQSGFQVWDVEDAHNVHELASRYDGPVSFLQMQQKPVASRKSEDGFADVRPLLVIAGDGSSNGISVKDGSVYPSNGNLYNGNEQGFISGNALPTVIRFYSLRSHSYVHILKFRSAIYSIRCSPRVVAISQVSQIHCVNAATLEREYTILTHPVVSGIHTPGSIGYGPLAVGPRWLAYSGSPVVLSNTGRVSPQHLTPSASFSGSPSNSSLVAHYAKESSKQLAAGIVILGDIGYKKLSRYCSELLPESNNSLRSGFATGKCNGTIKGHIPDPDTAGMVIVRDIVSKSVLAQFRAHRSPISALCFDPSGTLLVTASIQGHSINVFRIMPSAVASSSGSDTCSTYTHLYKLQRGFTNAVIQDISFSDDSRWIMVSSSRGTSHLFAISPSGGMVNLNSTDANSKYDSIRIKNGNSGWRGTVSGAAAAATGRISSLSGAIASSFHNCKCDDAYAEFNTLRTKYHLLVFSPSGCVIQYVLHLAKLSDSGAVLSGSTAVSDSDPDCDTKLVVEALQKWDICQRQNRRERGDTVDIYGEQRFADNGRSYPEGNSTVTSKTKVNAEERHHMYISEAELHTHQPSLPLWAKSEMYFQSMLMDGVKLADKRFPVGESEIERIPVCTIEARPKDRVPINNYLQTRQVQQPRVPAWDNNRNRWLMHQQPDLSEDGRLPGCKSNSCNSHEVASESEVVSEDNNAATEVLSGSTENGWGGSQISTESIWGNEKYIESQDTATQLDNVNNDMSQNTETNLKDVDNNDDEFMKMANLFGDDDN